ncbi:MAG: hypothetical protein CSB46_06685 [Micrococcales bacterium]|nr:MAG: hypothetical protein CSB46_06685 [Micrococcales bacterium]
MVAGRDTGAQPPTPGFITLFALAVVVILLVLDMIRRMRRLRYRGESAERARRAAEDPVPQGQPDDPAG